MRLTRRDVMEAQVRFYFGHAMYDYLIVIVR